MTKQHGNLIDRLCGQARKWSFVDRLVSRLFQAWYELPLNPYYLPRPRTVDQLFKHVHHLPVLPLHYYSPLPDITGVKRNLSRWFKESECIGIDWNMQGQAGLMEAINQYSGELRELPAFESVTQKGYGLGYGAVESQLLYLMMRYLKPSRVIEVGSGVSTFYIRGALRANKQHDGVRSTLLCVEPFPSKKLHELVVEQSVELQVSEVQSVPLERFQELTANDVLFIDSSHVSKKDSDVDYLFLEVLPRLKKGVVVHVHDISLPMPSLPLDHPLFDQYLLWNEVSLAKAFLLFNDSYQVIMCQSYLHHKAPELLKRVIPWIDPAKEFPTALWIKRVKGGEAEGSGDGGR